MNPTRRDFLYRLALGGACVSLGGLGLPSRLLASGCSPKDKPRVEPMKLLILGGTGFLGPHTVQAALDRGHEMTLFNRGRTNTHLFPDLEKLRGDRKGDLAALEGREWDAVIDTSGYVPRLVTLSTELLAPNVGQYIFISTKSVYASFTEVGMDESAPVGLLDDPSVEQITGETYGPLKALCEQAAEAALPGRVTNIRPGLIVGPGDRTDRFTYWPWRVQRGGEILTPGDGTDYTQFIDARDLGRWIITCIENETMGVFNAIRSGGSLTMGRLLEACRKVSDSDASFTWADAEFLAQHEVAPYSDMPCWVPADEENAGFAQVSSAKAVSAGLTHRALETTIRDTLDWFAAQPEERRRKLRAGLGEDRERELLAAWHAERG